MLKKGVAFEYLHKSAFRFNWFLSQIALTTLTCTALYGFRYVENTDWFVESSHKNWIPITQNVTEYATIWINKSKIGQYTWIKMQYGLASFIKL